MGVLDSRIFMNSKSSIALKPTTSGREVNRKWQDGGNNLPAMGEKKLKQDLWANVSALMRERWGVENVTRLGREAGIGGSASRIKAQDTAIGFDVIVKVAKAFKVPPHHLFLPPDERRLLTSEFLIELSRVYLQTDESGRRTIETAAQIAKARIGGGSAGMGKPSKANDR